MTNCLPLDRRAFLSLCSLVGVNHPAFADALLRRAKLAEPSTVAPRPSTITAEMIAVAEQIIGLEFTDAERALLAEDLNSALTNLSALRGLYLPNDLAPALRFDVEIPGLKALPKKDLRLRAVDERRRQRQVALPDDPDDLGFMSVADLAELVRTRRITSKELVKLSIDRLKQADPTLRCVVTVTEARALDQAYRADEEIARGKYRGPLHGIPWGAKDLFAVPGYPTTWGSPIYRDQVIDRTATVVERLDQAGAVLVAKLTLGELAQGDVWFGGTTKNPWKTDQGSSGSSAGSASATAAGLVPFAIGTETLGSIVSPSTRCGVTGLRPTFGRVSRHGAMTLCPSMDKVGPIGRSVEDCGLVFRAIHGADGRDATAVDRPFSWAPRKSVEGIRVGYLTAAFEAERATKTIDDESLRVIRRLGIDLIPVKLDVDLPVQALRIILSAEAAASFDELTRSNKDEAMVRQGKGSWPASFRAARFISAVDYINANRLRTSLMRRMDEVMQQVDVLVTPTFGGNGLLITNLTGHPALVLPNGFNPNGTPVSLSFIGMLYGEEKLLAVGHAYQQATEWHLRRPQL